MQEHLVCIYRYNDGFNHDIYVSASLGDVVDETQETRTTAESMHKRK